MPVAAAVREAFRPWSVVLVVLLVLATVVALQGELADQPVLRLEVDGDTPIVRPAATPVELPAQP